MFFLKHGVHDDVCWLGASLCCTTRD